MMRSPFEVTKAVDFNDPQIERTYVSFGGRDRSIVDPSSPMPQFLTGMKGGGRTHLMRHYSFPLQQTRGERVLEEIQKDGYLGVYFRCSGLNGSRFSGRGQSAEAWASAFSYYMDLWLTELLIATVCDIEQGEGWGLQAAAEVRAAVAESLHAPELMDVEGQPLHVALGYLSSLRSELDWLINNAAHTGRLDFEVRANPGVLLFRCCQAVAKLPGLQDIRITFLADEYENLTHDQQVYFNTLIREKEAPATFLVGARSWGVKTQLTLSAGEENKRGSEYEEYSMEDAYAKKPREYESFCRNLITVRLTDFGLSPSQADAWISRLSFESDDKFFTARLASVLRKYDPADRPYLVRLRSILENVMSSAAGVDAVVDALSMPEYPLLEKLAVLRFYQQWSGGHRPSATLAKSSWDSVAPLIDGSEDSTLANFFNQRKSDAVAQIYSEVGRQTAYAGFTELVGMSGFLPRSLLMILKYVSHWADFHGEDVFYGGSQISERALSEGVLDAANWYLADAKPLGSEGEECEIAVRRLGRYLQSIRYSDKPSEIDVTTFSSNLERVAPEALEVLERCIDHGLLIEVRGGRASRNFGATHRKFQLHPMLTPIWGLRPGRRGDATFTAHTIEAIFSPLMNEGVFADVHENLVQALNAPFRATIDSRHPLF